MVLSTHTGLHNVDFFYIYLLVWGFSSHSEIFHWYGAPLPGKVCKFWPCHPYCQCTILTLSSEELVLLKHNSLMPLSVAFEEQQKPLEPQHLLCFGRDIITSQGYLTLTVLIFRSRARIRIPGLVKTWKWLLVVLQQVFYSLSSFAAIINKLIFGPNSFWQRHFDGIRA